MYAFEGRGGASRMVARVPVVPGPDGAAPPREDWPWARECSACGYGDANGVLRRRVIIDRVALVLCVDWQACCARFREASS